MEQRKWTRAAELAGLISIGIALVSALFLAYGRLVALEVKVVGLQKSVGRIENAMFGKDSKAVSR